MNIKHYLSFWLKLPRTRGKISTAHWKTIYDVDYAGLRREGIKLLIFDVDDTIAAYEDKIPQRTIHLLKNDIQVRNAFQDKFRHILVDEFQDVNTLQVRLLKYLLTKSNQLFCVGDDWQSIYGWRGAEVDYIVNFKKYFENPEIIKLNINYRSNNTIVLASNEVIKNNKYKIDKEISSINKEGRKIYLYCAQKEEEDGVETVVKKIKQFLQNGYSKEDILVLYRRTRAIESYKDKLRGLARLKTIHSAKGLEASWLDCRHLWLS